MGPGTVDEREAEQLALRLRNASSQVRQLAHDLQLDGTTDGSLEEDLRRYLATLKGPDVPEIRLDVAADKTARDAVRQGAYLVILEAVNNVVRHARARHARVTVNGSAEELVLEVTDDGVGLAKPYVSGVGITSMRSRVQALGGTFELEDGKASGTRLTAHLPIHA